MTRNHLLPFLVLLLAPLAAGPSEPQPTSAVLRGGICINEVHPSPASAPGTDANGDGSATNDDQYIELYNLGTETISLEGLELWTPLGRFYNFPAGAELPPGEFAFVVLDAPPGAPPPEAGIRFDADIDRMDGFLAEQSEDIALVDSVTGDFIGVHYGGASAFNFILFGPIGFSGTNLTVPSEYFGLTETGSALGRAPDGTTTIISYDTVTPFAPATPGGPAPEEQQGDLLLVR